MHSYSGAINLALKKAIEINRNTLIIGQGVTGEKRIFNTTKDLPDANLLEFPICEESMTGFAIGLATNGYNPILSHIRLDFTVSSMNQIVNMADKIHQMFGKQQKVPLVIRGIIGRSWGQGSQHSGGFYPIFCHFPNLNVYAPVTASDAYHSILNGIRNTNPTIIIEHRKLYESSLTSSLILNVDHTSGVHTLLDHDRPDITVVGISRTAIDCLKVNPYFETLGINLELFYPFILNPLEISKIEKSANITKKVLIVENSWINCGISAEISARLPSDVDVHRLGFHNSSCPASSYLEDLYYPDPIRIAQKILEVLDIEETLTDYFFLEEDIKPTKGPF